MTRTHIPLLPEPALRVFDSGGPDVAVGEKRYSTEQLLSYRVRYLQDARAGDSRPALMTAAAVRHQNGDSKFQEADFPFTGEQLQAHAAEWAAALSDSSVYRGFALPASSNCSDKAFETAAFCIYSPEFGPMLTISGTEEVIYITAEQASRFLGMRPTEGLLGPLASKVSEAVAGMSEPTDPDAVDTDLQQPTEHFGSFFAMAQGQCDYSISVTRNAVEAGDAADADPVLKIRATNEVFTLTAAQRQQSN